MTLLMTQQPCHFASGRVENAHATGKTSCTLRLLRWCKRERLAARGIDLSIRIARVFRAAWTDEAAHRDEVRSDDA